MDSVPAIALDQGLFTIKQAKTRFKERGLEKNIRERNMRSIFRKELKRKAENLLID